MRFIVVTLAISCACPATAQTKTVPSVASAASEFPQVDEFYWLAPRASVRLCPKPAPDIMDRIQCPEMKPGKFMVTEVLLLNKVPAYYRIEAEGQAGYVRAEDRMSFVDEDPQAKPVDVCTEVAKPRIGMTLSEVGQTCWGKPNTIKRVSETNSLRVQYIYPGGRYLYLERDVVVAVEEPR